MSIYIYDTFFKYCFNLIEHDKNKHCLLRSNKHMDEIDLRFNIISELIKSGKSDLSKSNSFDEFAKMVSKLETLILDGSVVATKTHENNYRIDEMIAKINGNKLTGGISGKFNNIQADMIEKIFDNNWIKHKILVSTAHTGLTSVLCFVAVYLPYNRFIANIYKPLFICYDVDQLNILKKTCNDMDSNNNIEFILSEHVTEDSIKEYDYIIIDDASLFDNDEMVNIIQFLSNKCVLIGTHAGKSSSTINHMIELSIENNSYLETTDYVKYFFSGNDLYGHYRADWIKKKNHDKYWVGSNEYAAKYYNLFFD